MLFMHRILNPCGSSFVCGSISRCLFEFLIGFIYRTNLKKKFALNDDAKELFLLYLNGYLTLYLGAPQHLSLWSKQK